MGIQKWWYIYDSFLGWAKAIENATGRQIECLDIGGGWFPDDADRVLRPKLQQAVSRAIETLPHLREFCLEPGKALTQSVMALAIRVLEIRFLETNHKEAVVDGAISDLPLASSFPHRVLAQTEQGEWQSIGRGNDRILGRSCMESDILSEGVQLPYGVRPGDILIMSDAGAYDRSMSYEFGQ